MSETEHKFFSASKLLLATSSVALASLVFKIHEDSSLFGLKFDSLSEAKFEESLFLVASFAALNFVPRAYLFVRSENGFIKEFWRSWGDLDQRLQEVEKKAARSAEFLKQNSEQLERQWSDLAEKRQEIVDGWDDWLPLLNARIAEFDEAVKGLASKELPSISKLQANTFSRIVAKVAKQLNGTHTRLKSAQNLALLDNLGSVLLRNSNDLTHYVGKVTSSLEKIEGLSEEVRLYRTAGKVEYWRIVLFNFGVPSFVYLLSLVLIFSPNLLEKAEQWNGFRAEVLESGSEQ